MNRVRLLFRISKVDIVDALRAGALVVLIVMTITFFAGCVTEEIGPDGSVIKKRKTNRQTHGEAGAYDDRRG